jgi:predicted Zn-dependent protease
MTLPADELKEITARILSRSQVDSCSVWIGGSGETHFRFAKNNATTNGHTEHMSVYIESNQGERSGSARATGLDDAALAAAQARSEEIARMVPPNPEFMPPLGAQTYEPSRLFDEPTVSVPGVRLADAAGTIISQASEHDLDSSGFAAIEHQFNAYATSAGLFAYSKRTNAGLSATCRNKAGTWSGWAAASAIGFADLNPAAIGARAAGKAAHSGTPFDLDPGHYTVILEPAAVAEMLRFLMWSMDTRAADEGRSFLSQKGGGNRLGEQLFGDGVTIYSDPGDPVCPDEPIASEGLPRQRRAWIENGVVKTMTSSRFWAQKQGHGPVPPPESFVMAGGTVSVDDMIRETKRGILVTRFWYTNFVDPRTLLITGLTRDGNFYIENGRIAGPARNLRFNESVLTMLKNIVAMGKGERAGGEDFRGGGNAVPPLLVKDFNFSSRSGGI